MFCLSKKNKTFLKAKPKPPQSTFAKRFGYRPLTEYSSATKLLIFYSYDKGSTENRKWQNDDPFLNSDLKGRKIVRRQLIFVRT